MERVFKRKIYQDLLDWKTTENGRTAIMVEGARRVGKSTIVEQFAQQEYESYILIDFNKAKLQFAFFLFLFYNFYDKHDRRLVC